MNLFQLISVVKIISFLSSPLIACIQLLQTYQYDWRYINGLVQDCSISIASALETLQSSHAYTKPSIYAHNRVCRTVGWGVGIGLGWGASLIQWTYLSETLSISQVSATHSMIGYPPTPSKGIHSSKELWWLANDDLEGILPKGPGLSAMRKHGE